MSFLKDIIDKQRLKRCLQLLKSHVATSVNGNKPDSNGAVKVDVGVKTIDSITPDEAGNVKIPVATDEEVEAGDVDNKYMTPANTLHAINKRTANFYNSVADMKADRKLKAGMTACTLGYYSPNDGGAGTYIIRAKQDGDVDDGGSLHELKSGNVAELVVENGTVCPEQFGAKGDGVTDDSETMNKCCQYATTNCKIVTFINDYHLNSSITINGDIVIHGNFHKITSNINNVSLNMFVLKGRLTMLNVIAENNIADTESGWGFCFCDDNTVIINNCIIKGFRSGIHVIGNYSCIMNNIIILSTVKDVQKDTFYGIHGEFNDSVIANNEIYNGRHSIYLSGRCENDIVQGNRCFASIWQNIHVYNLSYDRKAHNIKIIDNIVDATTTLQGIGVIGFGTNVDVTNNTVYSANGYAIKIEGNNSRSDNSITVCNNKIIGKQGLWIYNIKNVIASDNKIRTIYTSILCEASSHNITIKGNVVDCTDSKTDYILWIASAFEIQITDNIMTNLPSSAWVVNDNNFFACGYRIETSSNIALHNNKVDKYIVDGVQFNEYVLPIKTGYVYNAVPQNMPHQKGDKYYLKEASDGGYAAVCTVAGTPGTFKYI